MPSRSDRDPTSAGRGPADTPPRADVVVLGATPGGIAAAVAAARQGHSVLLIEYHRHIGGMAASGLGKSDIEHRELIGGLFREFTERVLAAYLARDGADSDNLRLCDDGYYYEPSIAEAVFEAMVGEQPAISVRRGARLTAVEHSGPAVTAVKIVDRDGGRRTTIRGRVFVDATYEGDLYAAAGADFRLGRESRDAFDESHAGVVYYDYQEGEFLPDTTGAADDRLPAYTYRLCLTTDPANARRLTEPPAGYDRSEYVGYFDDLAAGRLSGPKTLKPGRGYNPAHFDTLVRALSVTDIPNRKTDVNINPRPLGFPFPEENRGYIEGDDATRQRIRRRHRDLTLGLLWFLQNDEQIPAEHRRIANGYHLPLDEFTDNGHFPFQLYVREGRRLVGAYTLTEHDMTTGSRRHDDAIAVGEFPIDSFPCRKRQPGDTQVLEGYLGMLDALTRPYEIPYRIMIPLEVENLIVPVAASTTHVAYSSIRMEPTWMALGQAAGTAAHLALRHDVSPRHVPVGELQRLLAAQDQVVAAPDA
ncbi:MAG: FAD-dependent oxidoreductase [Chloroflexota bacterium]|nr:FAD-dependent oxidoreductase [Chloroflexota bacterium]